LDEAVSRERRAIERSEMSRRWKVWSIAGIGVLALVIGGPWVYIHLIQDEAPPPLALGSTSASGDGATGSAPTTGGDSWTVTDDSVVGYRVKEVLFGQSADAVGRTSAIAGTMTLDGATVTDASFTVDMTTVTSDESRRDDQFNGRIMETSVYPTATFTMSEPIDLGTLPDANADVTATATGELTLHGVTQTMTFDIQGRYTGSQVEIAGSIPITFADWGISNPSFGPVTTEDNGILEFSLVFFPA
jgi:polyisoprenoid-binding protein YceI